MAELHKILLYGLRFYGYHGVYVEEKSQGQWFDVDLELWGDYSRGAANDQLSDTLNYSLVYQSVKEIVEGASVNLIEHLAQRIMERLLLFPGVEKVMVRVKKPDAPLGGPLKYAGIEMVSSKNEK